MSKVILFVFLIASTPISWAAQWITLTSVDIRNIQLIQQQNSHGSPEGLYISLKSHITDEAATYCVRKDFIAITDPQLIDRVYSGLMFASATKKTFRFYLNGANSCVSDGPLATMFILEL